MDVIKIALIILVAVITVSCLPVWEKSIVSAISISVSLIVLWFVINTVLPIVIEIKSVFNSWITTDLSVVFKAMGISLITQFVADLAIDNGNKTLANQMIFAGKIAIVVLAMPIYFKVLEILGRIVK